jgi:ABC-2 type transport system permease protein
MKTFLTLLGREVTSYFYSPIAYVVMFYFLIVAGFNFYIGVEFLNRGPSEITVVEMAFNTVPFWWSYVLIFPLLTMRTYAEEYRMGTFETLTTAPVEDWMVVLGKFLGAYIFYCILWVPTFCHFAIFQYITGKTAATALGAYGGSYLLLALMGSFFTAIGCLASAFTKDQIIAAIISFSFITIWFFFGLMPDIWNVTDSAVRDLFGYISALQHMADFSRGLIDSRRIVWYVSMTALILAFTLQVFQYRKWKA